MGGEALFASNWPPSSESRGPLEVVIGPAVHVRVAIQAVRDFRVRVQDLSKRFFDTSSRR